MYIFFYNRQRRSSLYAPVQRLSDLTDVTTPEPVDKYNRNWNVDELTDIESPEENNIDSRYEYMLYHICCIIPYM